MDAMQRTNLVLAKVLNLARENGVSHWRLRFSDLELGEEFESHFYPCVEWLEREGLISVGSYARTMPGLAGGQISNIALTSRGMLVLGHQIEIGGAREEFANTIEKVSKGRAEYNRIGDTIGGIIGGIYKSLSS